MIRMAYFKYLFACAVLILFPFKIHAETKNPDHKIHTQDQIQILYLKGTWREMGFQYGTALKTQMWKQFDHIRSYTAKYQHFHTQQAEAFIQKKISLYLKENSEILQGHSGDMIKAIANATGMPIWKLIAISYPFDLAIDANHGLAPNCSFIAIQKDQHVISGRNMDWIQSMKPTLEKLLVTIYQPTENNPDNNKTYTIGHIGLLGSITGGNSKGLFAELNSGHLSTGDIVNPSLSPYPLKILDMLVESNNLTEFKNKVTDWSHYQPEEAFTVGMVGFDPEKSRNEMLTIEIASSVRKDLEPETKNLFYQIRSAESQTIFENDKGTNIHSNVLVSTNVFRMPDWDFRLPEKNPVTQQDVFPYKGMQHYPSGDPNDFCVNEYEVKCCAEETPNSCFNAPPPTKSMSFFRYNNLLALGKKNADINLDKMKTILDTPLSLEEGIGGSTESSGMPTSIKNYNNDFTYYQTIYDTKYPKKIWVKIPNTDASGKTDSKWIELNLEKYGL